MITHSQFQVVRLRAAIFFSYNFDLPIMKILKGFPGRHEEKFDDAPFVLPDADKMPAPLPPEVPRVTFKSKLGKWVFQIARSRADVFLGVASEGDVVSPSMFHQECAPILIDFIKAFNIEVSRFGAVCERFSVYENPGLTIAKFFCKDSWTSKDGALNRPESFELHAHKVYDVPQGFSINSWLRCRSGQVAGAVNGPAILVEQDINTFPKENGTLLIDECSVFFQVVSEEMEQIMELYFPSKEAQ